MQKSKVLVVFILVGVIAEALLVSAQSWDVVLWDSLGPYFRDVKDVGTCSFVLSGTITSYENAYISGQGCYNIYIWPLGILTFTQGSAAIENVAGYYRGFYFYSPGFSRSYSYPYPADVEAEMWAGWHYEKTY